MVSYVHNHLSVLLPGSTAQFLPWLEELLLWKLETDSLNKFDIGFRGVLEGQATCALFPCSFHP